MPKTETYIASQFVAWLYCWSEDMTSVSYMHSFISNITCVKMHTVYNAEDTDAPDHCHMRELCPARNIFSGIHPGARVHRITTQNRPCGVWCMQHCTNLCYTCILLHAGTKVHLHVGEKEACWNHIAHALWRPSLPMLLIWLHKRSQSCNITALDYTGKYATPHRGISDWGPLFELVIPVTVSGLLLC